MSSNEEAKHLPANLKAETLKRAKSKLLDTWQARWTGTQKGRWTYECFPDIRQWLRLPIALGHEVAQFLTGHGNFQTKLAELGLRPSPMCSCGNGNEDAMHVIYECPTHEEHRTYTGISSKQIRLPVANSDERPCFVQKDPCGAGQIRQSGS